MDKGRTMIDPQEHVDAVSAAASLIHRFTTRFRMDYTRLDSVDDWNGNEAARKQHERDEAISKDAENAADYLAELQSERDQLLSALTDLIEEEQPLGIDRAAYQNAIALIIRIEERDHQEHTCT